MVYLLCKMAPKQHIKIIKVSSDTKYVDRPQVFPKLPRLYLELLENKTKIKQDLINKEHNSNLNNSDNKKNTKVKDFENKLDKLFTESNDDVLSYKSDKSDKVKKRKHNKDDDKNGDDKDKDDDDNEKEYDDKDYDKQDKDNEKNDTDIDDDNDNDNDKHKDKDNDNDKDNDTDIDDNDDKHNSKKLDKYDKKKRDKYNNDTDDDDDDKYDKKNKYNDIDDDDTIINDNDSKHNKKRNKDNSDNYSVKSKDSNSSDENLNSRLNELLDDSDKSSVETKKSSHRDKYNKYRNTDKYSVDKKQAPSLAELENKRGFKHKQTLRDINNISYSEQEEEELKREIMFKIEIMKKKYPNAVDIPEFSIYTDYQSMKRTFDRTVQRISLDSSVENYKKYLIFGFLGCEFLLGQFFKFDMQGFTQQQILTMNTYETLLIELGEKTYVPTGSKFPVEVRLLFMIIMNAGFFIVSKMLFKKTGSNILSMVNSMNASVKTPQKSKHKMRGPTIDVDNLDDIN